MTYDGSMSDALTWAQNMHSFLTVANVSGIEWWELAYSTNPTYGLPNGGFTDGSFNPAKRFWAEGNWSRFVRSGWVRIGATASPQTGVFVTAFENPSSKAFAVVAVNSNAKSVSQQFVLNSLSASSVTPYVTDPSNDLAAQPSASVSSGSFTSTLSASSVTTFVALAGGPTPPSNLTGTVVQ